MEYYVIKKKVSGEYLLSGKNEVIKCSQNEHECWDCFNNKVFNKNLKSDVYVICCKDLNERYIQILRER